MPKTHVLAMATLPKDYYLIGWGEQINKTEFAERRPKRVFMTAPVEGGRFIFTPKPVIHQWESGILYAAQEGSEIARKLRGLLPEEEGRRARKKLWDLVRGLLLCLEETMDLNQDAMEAIQSLRVILNKTERS